LSAQIGLVVLDLGAASISANGKSHEVFTVSSRILEIGAELADQMKAQPADRTISARDVKRRLGSEPRVEGRAGIDNLAIAPRRESTKTSAAVRRQCSVQRGIKKPAPSHETVAQMQHGI